MTEYKREVKKVLGLFICGFIVLIAFMIYGRLSISDLFVGIEETIFTIGLIFYPIGIVYGWRSIIQFYRNFRSGDRGIGRTMYSVWITVIWISLAVFVTLLFGWVFGTVNAYKKLRMLRSNIYVEYTDVEELVEEEQ